METVKWWWGKCNTFHELVLMWPFFWAISTSQALKILQSLHLRDNTRTSQLCKSLTSGRNITRDRKLLEKSVPKGWTTNPSLRELSLDSRHPPLLEATVHLSMQTKSRAIPSTVHYAENSTQNALTTEQNNWSLNRRFYVWSHHLSELHSFSQSWL